MITVEYDYSGKCRSFHRSRPLTKQNSKRSNFSWFFRHCNHLDKANILVSTKEKQGQKRRQMIRNASSEYWPTVE